MKIRPWGICSFDNGTGTGRRFYHANNKVCLWRVHLKWIVFNKAMHLLQYGNKYFWACNKQPTLPQKCRWRSPVIPPVLCAINQWKQSGQHTASRTLLHKPINHFSKCGTYICELRSIRIGTNPVIRWQRISTDAIWIIVLGQVIHIGNT